MILDNVDLKIIQEFYKLNGKKVTSWKLMKKVYPKGKDLEHMNIRSKIKRMSKHNIFFISKNKNKTEEYILIKDFVKINRIPIIKNCVSIRVDGKWEIYET